MNKILNQIAVEIAVLMSEKEKTSYQIVKDKILNQNTLDAILQKPSKKGKGYNVKSLFALLRYLDQKELKIGDSLILIVG
jgi:hypothetical protein